MDNEVRLVVIAGLGQMHFVAEPPVLALDSSASIQIRGGSDDQGGRRDMLIAAPVAASLFHEKLLHPHPPYRFHGWQFC
jgi:hypothetical protein